MFDSRERENAIKIATSSEKDLTLATSSSVTPDQFEEKEKSGEDASGDDPRLASPSWRPDPHLFSDSNPSVGCGAFVLHEHTENHARVTENDVRKQFITAKGTELLGSFSCEGIHTEMGARPDVPTEQHVIPETMALIYSNNASESVILRERDTEAILEMEKEKNKFPIPCKTCKLSVVKEVEEDAANEGRSCHYQNCRCSVDEVHEDTDNFTDVVTEHDLDKSQAVVKSSPELSDSTEKDDSHSTAITSQLEEKSLDAGKWIHQNEKVGDFARHQDDEGGYGCPLSNDVITTEQEGKHELINEEGEENFTLEQISNPIQHNPNSSSFHSRKQLSDYAEAFEEPFTGASSPHINKDDDILITTGGKMQLKSVRNKTPIKTAHEKNCREFHSKDVNIEENERAEDEDEIKNIENEFPDGKNRGDVQDHPLKNNSLIYRHEDMKNCNQNDDAEEALKISRTTEGIATEKGGRTEASEVAIVKQASQDKVSREDLPDKSFSSGSEEISSSSRDLHKIPENQNGPRSSKNGKLCILDIKEETDNWGYKEGTMEGNACFGGEPVESLMSTHFMVNENEPSDKQILQVQTAIAARDLEVMWDDKGFLSSASDGESPIQCGDGFPPICTSGSWWSSGIEEDPDLRVAVGSEVNPVKKGCCPRPIPRSKSREEVYTVKADDQRDASQDGQDSFSMPLVTNEGSQPIASPSYVAHSALVIKRQESQNHRTNADEFIDELDNLLDDAEDDIRAEDMRSSLGVATPPLHEDYNNDYVNTSVQTESVTEPSVSVSSMRKDVFKEEADNWADFPEFSLKTISRQGSVCSDLVSGERERSFKVKQENPTVEHCSSSDPESCFLSLEDVIGTNERPKNVFPLLDVSVDKENDDSHLAGGGSAIVTLAKPEDLSNPANELTQHASPFNSDSTTAEKKPVETRQTMEASHQRIQNRSPVVSAELEGVFGDSDDVMFVGADEQSINDERRKDEVRKPPNSESISVCISGIDENFDPWADCPSSSLQTDDLSGKKERSCMVDAETSGQKSSCSEPISVSLSLEDDKDVVAVHHDVGEHSIPCSTAVESFQSAQLDVESNSLDAELRASGHGSSVLKMSEKSNVVVGSVVPVERETSLSGDDAVDLDGEETARQEKRELDPPFSDDVDESLRFHLRSDHEGNPYGNHEKATQLGDFSQSQQLERVFRDHEDIFVVANEKSDKREPVGDEGATFGRDDSLCILDIEEDPDPCNWADYPTSSLLTSSRDASVSRGLASSVKAGYDNVEEGTLSEVNSFSRLTSPTLTFEDHEAVTGDNKVLSVGSEFGENLVPPSLAGAPAKSQQSDWKRFRAVLMTNESGVLRETKKETNVVVDTALPLDRDLLHTDVDHLIMADQTSSSVQKVSRKFKYKGLQPLMMSDVASVKQASEDKVSREDLPDESFSSGSEEISSSSRDLHKIPENQNGPRSSKNGKLCILDIKEETDNWGYKEGTMEGNACFGGERVESLMSPHFMVNENEPSDKQIIQVQTAIATRDLEVMWDGKGFLSSASDGESPIQCGDGFPPICTSGSWWSSGIEEDPDFRVAVGSEVNPVKKGCSRPIPRSKSHEDVYTVKADDQRDASQDGQDSFSMPLVTNKGSQLIASSSYVAHSALVIKRQESQNHRTNADEFIDELDNLLNDAEDDIRAEEMRSSLGVATPTLHEDCNNDYVNASVQTESVTEPSVSVSSMRKDVSLSPCGMVVSAAFPSDATEPVSEKESDSWEMFDNIVPVLPSAETGALCCFKAPTTNDTSEGEDDAGGYLMPHCERVKPAIIGISEHLLRKELSVALEAIVSLRRSPAKAIITCGTEKHVFPVSNCNKPSKETTDVKTRLTPEEISSKLDNKETWESAVNAPKLEQVSCKPEVVIDGAIRNLEKLHSDLIGMRKKVIEKTDVEINTYLVEVGFFSFPTLLRSIERLNADILQMSEGFRTIDRHGEDNLAKRQRENETPAKVCLKERMNKALKSVVQSSNGAIEKLQRNFYGLGEQEKRHKLEKDALTAEVDAMKLALKTLCCKEEYRGRELTNLRNDLEQKERAWEEMGKDLDQALMEKQDLLYDIVSLEGDLKECEASKDKLSCQISDMRNTMKNLKAELEIAGRKNDYGHLREKVELLKGSLALNNRIVELLKNESRALKEEQFHLTKSQSEKSMLIDNLQEKISKLQIENLKIKKEFSCTLKQVHQMVQLQVQVENLQNKNKCLEEELLEMRKQLGVRNQTDCGEYKHDRHSPRLRNGSKNKLQKLRRRLHAKEQEMESLRKFIRQRGLEKGNTRRQPENQGMEEIKISLIDYDDKFDERNRVFQQRTERSEFLENKVGEMEKGLQIAKRALRKQARKNSELKNHAEVMDGNYERTKQRLSEKENDLQKAENTLKKQARQIQELECHLEKLEKDLERTRKWFTDKESELEKAEGTLKQQSERISDLESCAQETKRLLEVTKQSFSQKEKELKWTQVKLKEKKNRERDLEDQMHKMGKLLDKTAKCVKNGEAEMQFSTGSLEDRFSEVGSSKGQLKKEMKDKDDTEWAPNLEKREGSSSVNERNKLKKLMCDRKSTVEKLDINLQELQKGLAVMQEMLAKTGTEPEDRVGYLKEKYSRCNFYRKPLNQQEKADKKEAVLGNAHGCVKGTFFEVCNLRRKLLRRQRGLNESTQLLLRAQKLLEEKCREVERLKEKLYQRRERVEGLRASLDESVDKWERTRLYQIGEETVRLRKCVCEKEENKKKLHASLNQFEEDSVEIQTVSALKEKETALKRSIYCMKSKESSLADVEGDLCRGNNGLMSLRNISRLSDFGVVQLCRKLEYLEKMIDHLVRILARKDEKISHLENHANWYQQDSSESRNELNLLKSQKDDAKYGTKNCVNANFSSKKYLEEGTLRAAERQESAVKEHTDSLLNDYKTKKNVMWNMEIKLKESSVAQNIKPETKRVTSGGSGREAQSEGKFQLESVENGMAEFRDDTAALRLKQFQLESVENGIAEFRDDTAALLRLNLFQKDAIRSRHSGLDRAYSLLNKVRPAPRCKRMRCGNLSCSVATLPGTALSC